MFKSRNKNIFYAALFSILVGTVVLNTLGNSLSVAGAFSLSGFSSLNPVKPLISSYNCETAKNWDCVEIKNIVIDHESSTQNDRTHYDTDDYHFIICNGVIGRDGQIITTENWEYQRSTPVDGWQNSGWNIIRIGIITSGINVSSTEIQVKRANLLAGTLTKKFDIASESIFASYF